MIRTLLKILAITLVAGGAFVIATVTVVDRTPYRQMIFYAEMDRRLDSLHKHLNPIYLPERLQIGWAKVNLTPRKAVPLAGYGARDPIQMEGVADSSYVRTVLFQKGSHKAALVTADLLIIHPEIASGVYTLLPEGWSPEEIYFTATHTHSGQGGWAPGVVGELFAGAYTPEQAGFIAERIVHSIEQATLNLAEGSVGFAEMSVDNLVRNRLAEEEGTTDPWLKVLQLKRDTLTGLLTVYSAHATCMTPEFHKLSGDFPAALSNALEADTSIQFAAYAAGAVGSMAPDVRGNDDPKKAAYMVYHLKEQLGLLQMVGIPAGDPPVFSAYRLRLPLRAPYFKLTENLAVRPYLFRWMAGEYPAYVSVLQMGKTVLIGLPADFSGELAVPLYQQARSLGLNLIITSFNGNYIGYVIRDDWYNLQKYEARNMSWYGPDAGSYLSEVVSRILVSIDAAGRSETLTSKASE